MHLARNHKKIKKTLDFIIIPLAVIAPLLIIPQLIEIWVHHKSDGASPVSWIGFTVVSLIWCFYGLFHEERPVVISNALAFSLNCLVVLGIIFTQKYV